MEILTHRLLLKHFAPKSPIQAENGEKTTLMIWKRGNSDNDDSGRKKLVTTTLIVVKEGGNSEIFFLSEYVKVFKVKRIFLQA